MLIEHIRSEKDNYDDFPGLIFCIYIRYSVPILITQNSFYSLVSKNCFKNKIGQIYTHRMTVAFLVRLSICILNVDKIMTY